MAKYLYIMDGEPEGYDCTFGCNVQYDFIEAESIEEAKQKIIGDVFDECDFSYYEKEYGLKKIRVIKVTEEGEIDVAFLATQERSIKEEAEKRMEYERAKQLVARFEKNQS